MFVYLAALGLSYGTWDLCWRIQYLLVAACGLLVVARELVVAACMWDLVP